MAQDNSHLKTLLFLLLFPTFIYYYCLTRSFFAEIINCANISFVPKTLPWFGRGNGCHSLKRTTMMSYIWPEHDHHSSPLEPLTLERSDQLKFESELLQDLVRSFISSREVHHSWNSSFFLA